MKKVIETGQCENMGSTSAAAGGGATVDLLYPFCGEVTTAYIWSLSGGGKKMRGRLQGYDIQPHGLSREKSMSVKLWWRLSCTDHERNHIEPESLLETDPRIALCEPVHRCKTRGMTWHQYDIQQKRNYTDVSQFLAEDVVRPVLGVRGDAGRYNELPKRATA